jgi:hypothetical protein
MNTLSNTPPTATDTKPPETGASNQLHKTGKFAVWLGVLQLLAIPLLYILLRLDSHVTQDELVGEMIIDTIYQLVIASILIIHGRKLLAITSANLDDSKKPLAWLIGVVVAGLLISLVGLVTGSASSSLLLVLFTISISRSKIALKKQALLPPPTTPTDATPPTMIMPQQ